MNYIYKVFLINFLFLPAAIVFSQSASVTWPLTSNQNPNTPAGNIQAQPETIGAGPAPLMSVFAYNGGQRLWEGNTGWVGGPLDVTRFIQFDAAPLSGNDFTVGTISFNYGDFPLSSSDFNIINSQVYYSTDGWANGTGIGSTLIYKNTAMQTFSQNVNVPVSNGQTFSVRIYIYAVQNGLTGTPTFAIHNSFKIEGTTAPAVKNTASICGLKFNDLNGSGNQQLNEPGLPGWTISLTYQQAAGSVTLTAVTDASGNYCFDNLAAGTYILSETQQAGWQQTYPAAPGTHSVTLGSGELLHGINFGNISDSTSPGDACITWGLSNSTAVTSASGNITGQSEILGPGTSSPLMIIFAPYTSSGQRLLVSGGWLPGTMDPGRYIEFNASPNAGNSFTVHNVSFNYGDNPLSANYNIINSQVYYSTDGWSTSFQLGSTLNYLNTTMQSFSVSNLNVTIAGGQTFSLRIYPYSPSGSIAATVSLAIHNTVRICGTTAAAGNSGSICGIKFNDLNGNGVQESGEPGLAGWTINLTYEQAAGPVTVTAETDAGGSYCFNNLADGAYTLTETQKAGWRQTFPAAPGSHILTISNGQSLTGKNFGNIADSASSGDECITWALLTSTAVTSVTGNITGVPEIISAGSPFLSTGVAANPMSVNGYSNGQQLWVGSSGGTWVADPPAPNTPLSDPLRYIQFDAGAAAGSSFTVTNISFNYGDLPWNSDFNILAFRAYYSTDGWSTSHALNSTPLVYLNTSMTLFSQTVTGVTVSGTQVFSLRIYPYPLLHGLAMIPSYATHNNVTICGTTAPVKGDNGSICGIKFNDINGNGIKEAGESGLSGWTINLTGASTAFAVTDENGDYCFNNLAEGTYTVSEVQKSGWSQTAPAAGTYTVSLKAGEKLTEINFGNKFIPAAGCVEPPSGMVAWWPLDEISVSSSVDLAGINNAGIRMNGALPVQGKVLMGLQFDGTDDYVIVPHQSELNFGTGNFSIDAWIKTSETSGERIIVDKQTLSGLVYQGYSFHLNAGYLSLQLADASPPNYFTNQSSGVFVADGNWHHVAVTVARNSATGVLFYKDGVASTGFNLTSRQGSLDNTGPLTIGRQSYADQKRFKGIIDEVEMFNRILTTQEILSIYNAGSAGKCKLTAGIEEKEEIPTRTELLQSYPNPFNPTTTIRYNIPRAGFVKITVYDLLGKEIKILVQENKEPGRYEVVFDASELTSGVYFYSLRAGDFIQNKKMILMK